MHSTADRLRDTLRAKGFKRHPNGTWRGNSPFRAGSDSQSFVVTFHDGEHGAYVDHVSGESGSLYDLAGKLGIDIPDNGRVSVADTKTAYDGLEDYARRHYAPVDAFEAARWTETEVDGRPALTWPARTGTRVRYIDAQGGYRWLSSGANCWYGLDRAVTMALEQARPLVLCNGEASTIVAQHYGIPAFCGTGGEGKISEDMLTELNSKWSDGQLIIALDCDSAGQKAAPRAQAIIGRGTIVDLGLSDQGDLADFCGLHTDTAMRALQRLAGQEASAEPQDAAQFIEFVASHALLADFQRFVEDDPTLFGRTIQMPFPTMRTAGGFANIMTTKKVWFIGNVSGGGKTMLSETLCDEFNRMGYNAFYIGSEWSPMELTARQVQRAYSDRNVVSYEDYLRYANGMIDITEQQRHGVAQAMRRIRARSGQTFFMQVNSDLVAHDPARGVVFLEDVMTAAGAKIRDLRANGHQIDIVIVDYLSLYDSRGTANNMEEYKAGVFKSYCKTLDVLGISTVQVKKDSEDRVMQKGGMLNQHDLYWVRPDKANLITTMNRLYKPRIAVEAGIDISQAIKPHINEHGQPEPTPNVSMSVVKNSVGEPYHHAFFHFDYARLRIVEGIHPDYYYDDYYKIPLRKDRYNGNGKVVPISEGQLNDL